MEGEEALSFLSSDGIKFEVSKPVAAMILATKPCNASINGIDAGDINFAPKVEEAVDGADHEDRVPVPTLEVRSRILSKVIEYCKHHTTNDVGEEDNLARQNWDQQFIDGLDAKTVISLGMAAEILKIGELQKLAGRKVTELFPVVQRFGTSNQGIFDFELVNNTYKSIIQKKMAEVEMQERALRAMSCNIPQNESDST